MSSPTPPRRWLPRVVGGLLLGLVLAEGLFWLRDGGAFPHLNIYVEDDKLGARLKPHASTKVSLAGAAATRVRTNALGLRGAELPAPGSGEVLVLGDSQVFGLGVEEDETFSARAAELLKRPVVNAGVPTFGPEEYLGLLEELLPERKPKAVVLVINMANDLFELDRPNTERHRVWDGWAVRAESAPDDVKDFPGRGWLFGRSHAVFALRRVLHQLEERIDDRGFDSEGTWQDVSGAAKAAEERRAGAAAKALAEDAERAALVDSLVAEHKSADERLLRTLLTETGYDHEDEELHLKLRASRGNVGDIVQNPYLEAARPVTVTAELIRQGTEARAKHERALRRAAERRRDAVDVETVAAFAARSSLDKRIAALRAAPPAEVRVQSPLLPLLERARALVEAAGAELVVVALPLDVQVSPAEWSKYGVEPMDMAGTLVLLEDLLADARRLGLRALDATAPLRAAQPGAFLDGDLHMSPKGHAALAAALAATLEAPPPLQRPRPGLPEGRTLVPTPYEWERTPEAIVRGSSRAGCGTKRRHEWLLVSCRATGARSTPTGLVVERGELETMALVVEGAAALLTPLLPGQAQRARFSWSDRSQTLVVDWEEGAEEPRLFFEAPAPPEPAPGPSPEAARLCACAKELGQPCEELYGAADPACASTYGESCFDLLACARGEQRSRPSCPEGFGAAGAAGHCFALCDERHPCAEGSCTPWMGGGICP